jgi:hypothetical protein
MEMKVHHGLVAVIGLVLATVLLSGTFLSEQYPLAAQAHSVGFDALAHSLFDGAVGK